MSNERENIKLSMDQCTADSVDAAGWALLFIWIGITPIAHIGNATALLGTGLIITGTQIVRKFLGGRWEAFRVAIGFLFAAAGIWKLFSIQMELFPFLCLAAGAAGLVAIIARGPRPAEEKTRT